MQKLTKEQKQALKRVWDRQADTNPDSYLQFRRLVQPTFGMDSAIVIPWAGMFLAIETDGYTHS
jgi:hypothetical protein